MRIYCEACERDTIPVTSTDSLEKPKCFICRHSYDQCRVNEFLFKQRKITQRENRKKENENVIRMYGLRRTKK